MRANDMSIKVEINENAENTDQDTASEENGGPWQRALNTMKCTLSDDRWAPLHPGIEKLAPVRQVLETAGARARVSDGDALHGVAFGFPDLSRPSSKVLLVQDHSDISVTALHRFPHPAGIISQGTALPCGLKTREADTLSLDRYGRHTPNGGRLVAVDHDALYLLRDDSVWRWDGRNEHKEGTANQLLASLVLRWSQR